MNIFVILLFKNKKISIVKRDQMYDEKTCFIKIGNCFEMKSI